jgi:hypothetical protein
VDQGQAAIIAAIIALFGALVVGVVTLRNESARREAEHQEAALQELRQRAADVFAQLFVVQHEMEWLTWHAVNNPTAVDSQFGKNYEATVHSGYPKLLAAMASVASLDMAVYDYLFPLNEEVYLLESRIAGALVPIINGTPDHGSSLAELQALHHDTTKLYRRLPPLFSEAMAVTNQTFHEHRDLQAGLRQSPWSRHPRRNAEDRGRE